MAKKIDPFDKFRAATLGQPSIKDAMRPRQDVSLESTVPAAPAEDVVKEPVINEKPSTVVSAPVNVVPAVAKISKNADRELVSFHISKDTKRKLGLLKYETGRQYNELYVEAIEDLLKKYGKLV